MGMVYYRERRQIKISQRKKLLGQCLGNYQVWNSRCLLPVEPGHITFLPLMCDTVHGILPTKEAHLSLGIQSFFGTLWHGHYWLSMWLISAFSLQLLWVWPKAPILNHIVTTRLTHGPKKTKILEITSQKLKSKVSFLGAFVSKVKLFTIQIKCG